MASSTSYSDAVKGSINTRNKPLVVLDIADSYKFSGWTNFRNIGLEILKHVQKLKLPLKLDKLTYGDGSCFMVATLQQCQRKEIEMYVSEDVRILAKNLDFMKFRAAVSNFMTTSNNPAVLLYKKNYEEHDMKIFFTPDSSDSKGMIVCFK